MGLYKMTILELTLQNFNTKKTMIQIILVPNVMPQWY